MSDIQKGFSEIMQLDADEDQDKNSKENGVKSSEEP